MDFQLKRIVLVDSYLPGQVAEVDVTGHTNISGKNGAGKTTFLKLVPLFYGDWPRNLTVKSPSGERSFTDWYLPREGSCIIYEYLSHGSPKLAVYLPRNTAPFYQIVLVDQAYDESLFIDVQRETIHPSNQFIARLRSQGISYHLCSSVKEYREIIMDGTVRGCIQYSLCGRNARMSALVPLFTGMFHRAASFDDLAQVIQEYALASLDVESREHLESFSLHRDRLNSAIREYNAYQGLERLSHYLPALFGHLENYHEAETKRTSLLSVIRARKGQLEARIDADGQAIRELDERIADQRQDYETRAESLNSETDRLLTSRRPLVAERNEIESTYAAMKEKDLPGRQKALEHLPEKRRQLESRRKELERLHGDLRNIREPMERAMREEEHRIQQTRERIHQSLTELGDEKAEAVRVFIAGQRKINRELHLSHAEQSDRLDKENAEITTERARLQERKKSPPIDPELERQLDLASEQFDQLREESARCDEVKRDAFSAYEKAMRHRESANREFLAARETLDEVEKSHENTLNLLNGAPDSLISFLKSSVPGWEHRLGKIIQPDLLRRQGLSPTLQQGADPQALCGVRIDFDALPEGQLTPQELEDRFGELKEQLEKAQAQYDKWESELERAQKQLNTAEKARAEADWDAQKAKSKADQQKITLEGVKEKVLLARRQSVAEIDQALARVNQSLEQSYQAFDRMEQNQRDEIKAHEKAGDEAFHKLEGEFQHRRQQMETLLEEENRVFEETIRRLRAQMDTALKTQGIDPAQMSALEQAIETLSETCRRLEGYQSEVDGYEYFMKESYPKLVPLSERIAEIDLEVERCQKAGKDLKAAWEKFERESQQQRGQLVSLRDANEQGINKILHSRLDDPGLASPRYAPQQHHIDFYDTMSVDEMVSEYARIQRGMTDQLDELKSMTDRFSAAFERYPNTPIADYWEAAHRHWAGEDDRILIRAKAVEEYFRNDEHGTVRKNLYQGFHLLSQIDIYRNAMQGFELNIQRFNRGLLTHLEQNIPFEMIDEVTPKITFELNELDYWKDLRNLADQVREWQAGEDRALPNETLIQSLQDYLKTFNESRTSLGINDFWKLIRFRFSIMVEGTVRTPSSPRELEAVSSKGLSYLVLILLFQGFVDMVRKGEPIQFTWALDELKDFDQENIRVLLRMLRDHQINLVTACPELDIGTLSCFGEAYHLETGNNHQRKFIRWRNEDLIEGNGDNPFESGTEGSGS